jgi:serine/threonine/tyrosine protein kinase RAD53
LASLYRFYAQLIFPCEYQINGEKIGKHRTGILREGNEVAFGTCLPQPQNGGLEDYREFILGQASTVFQTAHFALGFVYRHTAGGPAKGGLYMYYDMSHELGKGSFATVMKAVSRETGMWYAVKIIQDNKMKIAANDPGTNNLNAVRSTAFAREISILETLQHPNICQLKETFVSDTNICALSLSACYLSASLAHGLRCSLL